MIMLRLKQMRLAMPVIACAGLLIALAAPAAAQSEACVHMQVGSSYTATMAVLGGDRTRIGPSAEFTSGQTQCLPLDALGDGVAFTVSVRASSGGATTCQRAGSPRSATLPVAITYNASGTAQNVHCDAPTAAPASSTPGATCGQFPADDIPLGSYLQTCIDCDVRGCSLSCLCAPEGVFPDECARLCPLTALDLTGCDASQDIGNQNGVLTCAPR